MLGMDVGLELLDPAYLFDPIQGGFIELWPQPDK